MKKLLKKGFVAAACAATMLAGFGSANAADYTFIDLYETSSLLDGYAYELGRGQYENKAMGVNDAGEVVGYLKGRWNGGSGTHVISWDLSNGGTATDLGNMGSPRDTANAFGINENGQIAGTYKELVGRTQVYKPFVYDLHTGTQTNLTTELLSPTALAFDINDSGQTVGYTSSYVGTALTPFQIPARDQAIKTAFISNADGTLSYIPGAAVGTNTTDGSEAYAINNAGLVTGYSAVDGNWQAFLYDSSSDAFTNLGTLGGGLTSVGKDVNDLGVVVGYATRGDGVERAFLAFGGTMVDLGALTADGTSQAHAINEKGDIVGTSNGHAFMYSNGQMVDLNDYIDPSLGITLTMATGINNMGQIIGYGYTEFYSEEMNHLFLEEHAFALNPVTPTPVPPSVLLFGSGIAGLALFRRKVQA
jgi:probable HAF family extracellular repeat protein